MDKKVIKNYVKIMKLIMVKIRKNILEERKNKRVRQVRLTMVGRGCDGPYIYYVYKSVVGPPHLRGYR